MKEAADRSQELQENIGVIQMDFEAARIFVMKTGFYSFEDSRQFQILIKMLFLTVVRLDWKVVFQSS